MKVNFDHATHETIIRLTRAEALRLVACICRATETIPDSTADESAQVEDALKDLMA